ncbi:MAG TPA: IPT/TIG domain-containing protein [Terriglobales bacterium]
MRLSLVLFALVLLTGCGAGSGNRSRVRVGSGVFPPAITMLSPNTVPVGSPGFTITVVGDNFGPDALLYWNGAPASTILVNSKQLMAQITNIDLQTVGLVPIFVRTAGQNSNTVDFQVSIQ